MFRADGCIERFKVLVAHSNTLVSAGLEAAMRTQPDFEVTCTESEGVFSKPLPEQIDPGGVIVTDCMTGLELTADLAPPSRVLILTDDASEVSIRLALKRGVAGYLLLTASRETVIRAVRGLHKGETALDPVVSSKIVASLGTPQLSPRQIEVLSLIMMGLCDKAIAARLGRSVETAKSHVKRILSKLNSANRGEAAAVARHRGLVPASTMAMPASAARMPVSVMRSFTRRPEGSLQKLSAPERAEA